MCNQILGAAVLLAAQSLGAATPTFHASSAAFTAAVGTQVVDGYGSPPYPADFGIYDNATFSAFLGETDYETTGFPNWNMHQSAGTYCAGCNGSFRLTFTSTSVTSGGAVFGVALDVLANDPSLPYVAFVTYGDATTQNVALPGDGSFFGVTAPEGIVSIHFGLTNGGSTTSGSFVIDNLRIAAAPSGSGADLSLSQTESVDPVTAGSGAGNLTYVVTVANQGPDPATGVVLAEDLTLPAGVTVASVTPSAGSWATTTAPDGAWTVGGLANGASATLTVVLTAAAPAAPGTDVIASSTSVQAVNESDPDAADNSVSTSTSVVAPTDVTATKAVSGGTAPGETATYTVTLANAGPGDARDDPAVDEFVDVLPASLVLVDAQVTSGGGSVTTAANTVRWNGPIPAGGAVTLEITATIAAGLAPGTVISNQGTLAADLDGDGDNDSSRLTDDPATTEAGDATSFQIRSAPVPGLGAAGILLLAGLLASIGAWAVRRLG